MLNLLLILVAVCSFGQPTDHEVPTATPSTELRRDQAEHTAGAIQHDDDNADVAGDDEGGAAEQLAPADDGGLGEVVEGEAVHGSRSSSGRRLAYLIASILFIAGLKWLTHPRTAVNGNLISAAGMLLAVVATLTVGGLNWVWIIIGLVIGGAYGGYKAIKVEMTAMPEMVALFNGFGGIASVLVAGAALFYEAATVQTGVATALSGFIGSITFFGSIVAYYKLQNVKWIPNGSMFSAQQVFNGVLVVVCILLGWWLTVSYGTNGMPTGSAHAAYWLIFIVAAILGILITQPIGGADMPVVIALLNSYSGLAACATGFVISNTVLIIAGSLVGASGIILTKIMCKAMNRSLPNVIFGKMGPTSETPDADEVYKTVKSASPEEVAMLFDSAQKAIIIPGYGMAVSQCQHACRDLMNLLESRGCTVDFGVHPVAGRMPGHMNVLLAEANIPYDKLREMDEVNPEMEQYDVALVIGANDVVNPVARTDPKSPIAGMPIIDVDKARTCVVVKRSLSPGFAGIPNPLFAAENTLMMFGDGKKAMLELIAALKEG
ncbi:MAG: NAD(P)(+) transhydrogenase (Re/Si-specific) subunit beta [Phycisphaerales bacterium]|nr:NAD(P)(+) transhydrogenase (Re/Si-specific) subunit beta [Phycisphaerales bacterium]